MKEEKDFFSSLADDIRKTVGEIIGDFSPKEEKPKEKEKPKEEEKWEPVVEKGIRDLVEALNNHGLETFASCEGHSDERYKYVAFKLPKGVSLTIEKDGVSIHWLEENGN